MSNKINRAKLVEIISEQTGINAEQLIDTANFRDDLGLDSLDEVELIMTFEDELDTEISDEVAEKLHTVGDVVTALKAANTWEE